MLNGHFKLRTRDKMSININKSLDGGYGKNFENDSPSNGIIYFLFSPLFLLFCSGHRRYRNFERRERRIIIYKHKRTQCFWYVP